MTGFTAVTPRMGVRAGKRKAGRQGRAPGGRTVAIADRWGWLIWKKCRSGVRPRLPGIAVAALLLGYGLTAGAQELEPRRWSHLPEKFNFVGVAYAVTQADISIDPVLELVDVELDLRTTGAKYIRTFGLLGNSARVDITVPYQDAYWEGVLSGKPASTSRSGLADPTVRFSMNFLGSPSLQGEEFAKYRAAHPIETLAGAGLSVQLPLGQYYADRLLNLGENRFTFRPEIGLVHNHHQWSAEVNGSVGISTANDDFLNGNRREQDPFYGLQGHLVYTFPPGLWASIGIGYGYGGESRVNDVAKNDRKGFLAWGLSLGYPLSRYLGVKAAYLNTRSQESTGFDSDTIAASLSVQW